jgi:hypothetical protein
MMSFLPVLKLKGSYGALIPVTVFLCFALFLRMVSAEDSVHGESVKFMTVETSDFTIHIENCPEAVFSPSANETVKLLEQFLRVLDVQLAPVFGAERTRYHRTNIYLYADRTSFFRNLRQNNSVPSLPAEHPGGFFNIKTGHISLFYQPTPYYTRQVLLHEVVHWYLWRILGENSVSLPHWFQEGAADYFALHVWDGKTLQAGAVPQVMLEDYPARALAAVQTFRFGENVQRSLDQYALYWGMTRYLFTVEPTKLQEMIRHGFPENPVDWDTLENWLKQQQTSWLWVWNSWEQIGSGILGVSLTTGLIVRKDSPEIMRVRCDPQYQTWTVGLVFNFQSMDQFGIIQFRKPKVTADVFWREIHRTSSGWKMISDWQPFTSDVPKPQFAAHVTGGKMDITWNDKPVITKEILPKSQIGISVHESEVLFETDFPESLRAKSFFYRLIFLTRTGH